MARPDEQQKARGITLNQSVLNAVNRQLPGGPADRPPLAQIRQQAVTGREGMGLMSGGGGGVPTTVQQAATPATPLAQGLLQNPVFRNPGNINTAGLEQRGPFAAPSAQQLSGQTLTQPLSTAPTTQNFSGPRGFTLEQARGLTDRGQPGGGLSVIGGRSPEMQAAVSARVADINRQIEQVKRDRDPYVRATGYTQEELRQRQDQRFLEQQALGTDAIGQERPFMGSEGVGSMPSAAKGLRENQLLEQAARSQRQQAAQGLLGLQQDERMQGQALAAGLQQEQLRQASGLQQAQIEALGRGQQISQFDQTLQRERAKQQIGNEQAQIEQQKIGQQLFSQLDELEKLADISGFGTSALADINRFGEAIGIGGGELASKREAFDSIANGITAGLTKQLTGPLTEKELAFIKAQVPSVNNTEAGNRAIINNLRRFTELKMGGLSADGFIDSLSNAQQPGADATGGGGSAGNVGLQQVTPQQTARIQAAGVSLEDIQDTLAGSMRGSTIDEVLVRLGV